MSDAAPTAVLAAELSANPEPLIAGFQRAEQATGAWLEATKRGMASAQASFNGVNFDVVTTKAKAETIKMIELQHQLDVARASGDKATVAALTEEIALLSKVRQLRSAGFGADAGAAAKQQLEAVAQAREAAEAREAAAKRREAITGNPLEALEGAFSRTRLGVLEEGGAKIPIFGASLEALGAAGVAAGAGLLVAAEGAEKVKQAAEYAESLEVAAKSLGITTDRLQEYDFAALKAGVATDSFREGIRSGQEVFGAFLSNVGDGKAKAAFAALGITKEQARDLGSLTEALPLIADKIRGLGNSAEQAQIAKKLGLTELLPALCEGSEAFTGAAAQAHQLGIVLDESLVTQGARAAQQMKIASKVVDVDLKEAFVSLAPVLAGLLTKLAAVARYVADVFGGFQKVEDRADAVNRDALAQVKRANASPTGDVAVAKFLGAREGKDGRLTGGLSGATFNANRALDQQHEIEGVLARHDKEAKDAEAESQRQQREGAKALVAEKAPKEKRAPEDTTRSEDDSARNALDSATKDLATATRERAAAERKAVDDTSIEGAYRNRIAGADADAAARQAEITADLNAKLDGLHEKEAKVLQEKNDSHKAEQIAVLRAAAAKEEDAARQKSITAATEAAAEKERAARDRDIAYLQQAYALLSSTSSYVKSLHGIQQGFQPASSAGKLRNDLQNLGDDKDAADLARARQRDLDLRTRPQDARDINANFQVEQGRADDLYQRRQDLAKFQDASPFEAWARAGVKSADQVHDALETASVQALDDFNNGLAEAATNGKNLGDVLHGVFSTLEADAIRYLAKQAEIGLFGAGAAAGAGGGSSAGLLSGLLSALPHFAGGTDSAPGGLAVVGERGEEVVNLPRGASVTSNAALHSTSYDVGRLGRGGGGLSASIYVDAGGAFSFDHVADAVEAGMHKAVSASGLQLAAVTRRQGVSQRNDLSGR